MHRLNLGLVWQPFIHVALGKFNVRLLNTAVKAGCATVTSGSGALQGGCEALPTNPRSTHRERRGSV